MKIVTFMFLLLWPCITLLAQDTLADESTMSDSVAAQVEEASAQNEASPSWVSPDSVVKSSKYTRDDVTLRKFDQAKWQKVVKGANYDEAVPKESTGIRGPSIPWSGPVAKIVAYVVIAALIVLMIYYLLQNMSWSGDIARKQVTAEDIVRPVEDINDLDFESLLKEALVSANYRLAVRIYYLGLLKNLNKGGWILWKKDKTNRDYLSELFAKSYHFEEIRRLTFAYENVWYGEHTPSHESFQRIRDNFESVQRNLTPQGS